MNNISLYSCGLFVGLIANLCKFIRCYILALFTAFSNWVNRKVLHFEPCQYDKRLSSMSQRIENEEILNFQYFLYN